MGGLLLLLPHKSHHLSQYNLITYYDITDLTSCDLMEQEPMILTRLNGLCQSVAPVVLHYCPEQCQNDNEDITRCCITTYFSNSTQFECDGLPGVLTELKFLDAIECTCEPCG